MMGAAVRAPVPTFARASKVLLLGFFAALVPWTIEAGSALRHDDVCVIDPGRSGLLPGPVADVCPPETRQANSAASKDTTRKAAANPGEAKEAKIPSKVPSKKGQTDAPSPSPYAPWAHPPFCISIAQHAERGLSSEYCVYTSTTFRKGQGLSFIGPPDLAGSVISALPDEAVASELSQHPTSPLYVGDTGSANISYVVKDLPGRGKGALTTRLVGRMEVLLVGFPVLVVPFDFTTAFMPEERSALLEKAMGQLSEERRQQVHDLARSTGGDVVEDVLKTNGFHLKVGGKPQIGLLLEASRINHNCKPTVVWRYSPKALGMEVVALRDMDVGEELAHSYVTIGKLQHERQAFLKDYGFTCRCSICSPASAVTESDARRERIKEIEQALVRSIQASHAAAGASKDKILKSNEVRRLGDELLPLVEQEAMWPRLLMHYEALARAYMGAGNLKKARSYVELAERSWIAFGGREHDAIEPMKRLWAELEWRERQRRGRG